MSFRPLIVLMSGLACGCGTSENQAYGIKVVSLEFSDSDLADLRSSTFDKVKFAADVTVDDRKSSAIVGYAGRTSIDAYKKSWEVTTPENKFRLVAAIQDDSAVRTILGYTLFAMVGLPTPKVEPVAVYLNGEYQGLYTMVEPMQAEFFSKRGVANAVAYKGHHSNHHLDMGILHQLQSAFSGVTGHETWVDLEEFVAALNNQKEPSKVSDHLNLDSYYTYLAVAVLLNHWDGFENNYVLYRSGSERMFQVAPWDMDATLGDQRDVSAYGEGHFARQIIADSSRQESYRRVVSAVLTKMDWGKVNELLADLVEKLNPAFANDPVLSARMRTMAYEVEVLKTRLIVRRSMLESIALP